MIPFDYITEWRAEAPWTVEAQVEQDLILSRAVVALFAEPEVTPLLAFRGGTALYKLHLRPAARYSDDIDLVQVIAGPIGGVLDAIRHALDPWLGLPQRSIKEGRVVLVYRMTTEGQPPVPMRLKVEINAREHFSVFGVEEREFAVRSRWFSGTAAVKTYPLDELLGTTLRALYQRKKGRDLFDLFIAGRRAKVDPARVVECFVRYLEHDGKRVTRAEFEMNLHDKLSDDTFLSDVTPLVAPDVVWSIGDAAGYVQRELLPLLPGEAWRGGVEPSLRGPDGTARRVTGRDHPRGVSARRPQGRGRHDQRAPGRTP
ncbi:MAG: nucleotidyl transferase AbiEii/AbiGii toxin family protein [Spirochaetes bacterium]|nr:nucleotidyl transferase AbiEii/AbiGii toxin family protein [Spirochaetota bacterium]